jgi:hypothetical protein
MHLQTSSLEQQLGMFPQFKSSEVIQPMQIPAEGLISELLSESNFEEVAAGGAGTITVKENLKNMLIQMQ